MVGKTGAPEETWRDGETRAEQEDATNTQQEQQQEQMEEGGGQQIKKNGGEEKKSVTHFVFVSGQILRVQQSVWLSFAVLNRATFFGLSTRAAILVLVLGVVLVLGRRTHRFIV